MNKTEEIKSLHLKLAEEQGIEKTYCLSEVARTLFDDDWRDMMDDVRHVADNLVLNKKLYVLQKGIIQSDLPSELKGPIRLRIRKSK